MLVGVFAVYFVARNWDGISTGFGRLDLPDVIGSFVAVLGGLGAAALAWRAVLSGLGSHLPVRAAARVYFLGQLGKYVPGSIWPIMAQAELSKEYGVARARSGFAAVTQMLIGLVVGIVVAGATLAASSRAAVEAYWWLAVVAVGGVVTLAPPVFNRLMAVALRLARRPVGDPLSSRTVFASAGWCLAMWMAFGVHVWLLARGLGASGDNLLLLTTGAYALAWAAGFVVVFVPAGAGVREAALVLALSPAVGADDALALALVSRALMLVGDFTGAGVAMLAEKRRRRTTPDLRPGPSSGGATGEPRDRSA